MTCFLDYKANRIQMAEDGRVTLQDGLTNLGGMTRLPATVRLSPRCAAHERFMAVLCRIVALSVIQRVSLKATHNSLLRECEGNYSI
jgi:hypothetical protein